MAQSETPVPTPEQAALIARVRRLMAIAGLTTTLAIGAVVIAIGYRLFRGDASAPVVADQTLTLPKGARVVATGVAGDRLLVTIDQGGAIEIRSFDAKTLRPAGRLGFAVEP